MKNTQFVAMEAREHAEAAIAWLRRSIEATGGRGSAHSYSPIWGWAEAYPETTGYLIPVLHRYADLLSDDSLRIPALQCRDWLLGIQLPSGAWAGGLAGETRPSVFNTAMILRGIALPAAAARTKMEHSTRNPALHPASGGAESGVSWLLAALSSDGAWRSGAYVPGFVPSYYTYAVWSVLEAGIALHRPDVPDKMRAALHFYAGRFQADGTVLDWGLKPGRVAFTHTIAYTLQGFLESALLLGEHDILEKTIRAAEALRLEFMCTGRVAGRYGPGWRGDYSFTCPVGNAQISNLFQRLWETTGEQKYQQVSRAFLLEALRFQKFGNNPNTHGGLPGSAPFWGPYLRWRYPNWGAKFLLDALATMLPLPVPAGKP
ncbi:MAG: hypothetical protein IPM98_06825 [Lewinellaceae bacterium]|nr:hypothetical protein [Lewinellaceae bacterium]